MEILLATFLGGLLALDATSVGQFMVSRPLVAGAIVGWALGDLATGMTVGALLELYLLVSFPTGGSRFPEGATATVVAVAAAAGSEAAGALPLALAVGLVWGQVGGFSITALRLVNNRLVPEPGEPVPGARRLAALHLTAILLDFGRGAVVTLLGVWIGRVVVSAAGATWPLSRTGSLGLMLVGAAVSVGILLRDLGGFRRRRVLFTGGLALGILGARLL